MKKRIICLVVLVLLLGSSIGFAAGTSLVGAKVTGVYSLKQGGKKIADAAIINGSAYVPVRAMSEASGAELEVEGESRTITIETPVSSGVGGKTAVVNELAEKVNTLARNGTQIDNLRKVQQSGYADEANSPYYDYESTESYAKTTAEIKRLTAENEQLGAEITALQAQLDE